MNVNVALGDRGYDVVIEGGSRRQLGDLLDRRAPRAENVIIVSTASLAAQSWFDLVSGRAQDVLVVPEGESAKSLAVLETLLEEVARRGLSRADVIVAVGGGAITDLVGFAASTYLRGVGLVHVPTSLVAQVDAAIGGKTGVNLRAGKNLAGAFYQPLGVLCDPEVLVTLPDAERRSGLGEIAKCWLLEGRGPGDVADTPLPALVEMAVRLKVRLVVADERESGERVLLNYGHTLAHALEALALERGEALRHGEAVAVGVAFAVRLASELGRVEESVVAQHDATLDAFGLERRVPSGFDPAALVAYMSRDKKARHDLSFVLPGATGFSLVSGIDATVVLDLLARYQGAS